MSDERYFRDDDTDEQVIATALLLGAEIRSINRRDAVSVGPPDRRWWDGYVHTVINLPLNTTRHRWYKKADAAKQYLRSLAHSRANNPAS